ncbi:type III pantothenate kinase [Viridibacterium curvum]|uniref:Type III pantothenate kinase n=1 Tax=Viridibacterium curvum TaxID=1101404 RepID=A0ABP9QZD5_9RHOO
MHLFIDAGNTRIKYAAHDGQRWLFHRVTTGDALALDLPTGVSLRGALAASVASPAVNAALDEQCSQHGVSLDWFRSSSAACGVRNAYADPSQLGVDRWAAALAAWSRVQGPCLVVSAGTATTIDLIEADAQGGGCFAGGCILPGFDMMRRALAEGTARLPLAEGSWQPKPDRTQDAIYSGCLNAQLGAIERMRSQLPAGSAVLLAGGAAPLLRPQISAPVIETPDLVLEGLLRAVG